MRHSNSVQTGGSGVGAASSRARVSVVLLSAAAIVASGGKATSVPEEERPRVLLGGDVSGMVGDKAPTLHALGSLDHFPGSGVCWAYGCSSRRRPPIAPETLAMNAPMSRDSAV